MELAQKLESGELDTKMIIFTYCIKDDPTVGISLWKAKDKREFDTAFETHKKYYKEIIDVFPVVQSAEAKNLILEGMN